MIIRGKKEKVKEFCCYCGCGVFNKIRTPELFYPFKLICANCQRFHRWLRVDEEKEEEKE